MIHKLLPSNVTMDIAEFIKADPGYFFLELYQHPNEATEVFFHPIYSWAIESQTTAHYPATNEGVQVKNLHILRPDGVVYAGFEGGYCDSLEEWLAGMKATGAILHNGIKK